MHMVLDDGSVEGCQTECGEILNHKWMIENFEHLSKYCIIKRIAPKLKE